MGRFFFCVVWGAFIGASFAAPTTVPSEIGQLAGELSESVVDLISSAQEENPSTSDFDVAMEALIKKYVDFEKIVSKTYVDLTGKKEESEAASKSYYESVDAILLSVFGDEEEEEKDVDVTIDELAAAAKQISQKMVNLLPQLRMTPESLDELLAHGEVLFIIVTDVHEIIHPYQEEEEKEKEDDDEDDEEEEEKEGNRKKRGADIFWALKGHHGHHQGHHHDHQHEHQHEHHHGHQHEHHQGHQHGHHFPGHHHAHHNDVFWAVDHQRHHDHHGFRAQLFGHHHGHQGPDVGQYHHGHQHHGQQHHGHHNDDGQYHHGHGHHGQQHHGHHNDVFWATH